MLAGVPIHVVQRGNNRGNCFDDDEDRSFYLFHLGRLLARFACTLHAYCLMTNHVHLLFSTTTDRACERLMKQIGQLYAIYFNRKYKRVGSLWQGRYGSSLVLADAYLLACYRYIELNPVRAGMVDHPELYPWSSYRANAGLQTSPLVSPHAEYLGLAATDAARHAAYRDLVAGGLDTEHLTAIRAAAKGGHALESVPNPSPTRP